MALNDWDRLGTDQPANDWDSLSGSTPGAAVAEPQNLREFIGPDIAQTLTPESAMGEGYVDDFVSHLRQKADGLEPDSPERKALAERISGLQSDLIDFKTQQSEAQQRGVSVETSNRLSSPLGAFEQSLSQSVVGQAAMRAEQGLSDAAAATLSLTGRALGADRFSAKLHADKAQRDEFLNAAEKGGDVQKYLGESGSRIFNSVVGSTAKIAAVGTVAGPAAVYSLIGAEAFDDALAEGERNGMTGNQRLLYAGTKAATEVGLTLAMGALGKKLGISTTEESFSPGLRVVAADLLSKRAAPALSKLAAEGAGIAAEAAEEFVIDAVNQGVELTAGTSEKFSFQRLFEATAAGGGGRAAIGGAKEIARVLDQIPRQTLQDAAWGVAAADDAYSRVKNPGQPSRRDAFQQAEAAQLEPGKEGRGARGAKQFVENATPEALAKLAEPLTQKQFAELTGIKKTSKVFRDAFQQTAALYATPADAVNKVTDDQPADVAAPTIMDRFGEMARAFQSSATADAARDLTAGAEGTVNLGGEAVQRLANTAKVWLKENFTTAGLRNQSIETANDTRLGKIGRDLVQMEQLRSDLDRVVQEEFGGRRKLSPDQVRKIDDALKGKTTDLPVAVMAAIQPMRAHIDGLSRRILDAGVVDPDSDLGITIDENQGSYLTRTYRKHDQKNWAQQVRKNPEIIARARDWLAAEFPDDTAEHREWRLNAMLDKDSADATTPGGGPKSDRDFMSVLKERKDLPSAVRELYGEYRDPWINYTKSVAKMTNLLAHKQFMADVKLTGLTTGFLSTGEGAPPQNFRRIVAGKNPRLAELDGLYTDSLTAKALSDLFNPELQGSVYRMAVKASGYAKWAQTVGSTKTHVRNLVGNIVFAMSNGDLYSGGWRDAAKTTIDGLLNSGDDNARKYVQRLAELRLTDANIDVGDLRAMASEMVDVDSAPRKGVWGNINAGMAGLSRVYQSQDTFWKVLAFENKKRQYARVYPQATHAEIETLAADDVKAHYPTYSKLPRAVRKVGQFPLIGPFVSFPAEVIRTMKNSLVTIARDSQSENPHLREMAQQRAVGLVSSMTLVPALSAISKAIIGVSEEEEEDLRKFQPPWSENSQLFYLGKDGDGNYDLVDLSFLDARNIISKPILGALRDGDISDRVDRAVNEITSPLGEDLLFGRLMSVWRNKTEDGRDVYNEQADIATKAKEIGLYLGQVVTPGTVSQLDRIRRGVGGEVSRGGKPYDAILESAAMFGLRISSTDVKQAFQFRNADMERATTDAESGILSVAQRRGTVTPGEIDSAYRVFNARRRRLLHEWHGLAMSAIRLGADQGEVAGAVQRSAGKRDAQAVLADVFVPYLPSESALAAIATRPNGVERVQQLVGLFRDASERIAAEQAQ